LHCLPQAREPRQSWLSTQAIKTGNCDKRNWWAVRQCAVAGLAGPQDIFDFLDIDPAKVHTPTLNNATGSGGILNVTDGTHSANIALIGNYLASTFVPASDGHGGTAVHDPANGTAEPLVNTPHA
jgi:hypothetical protein